MAQPTVLPGPKLLILVGDGGSPEVFATPCGLTSNTFSMTAATGSTSVPDCSDPELPVWDVKDITSLSAQVTGTGVMAVESFHVWNDWFTGATAKNVQIKLDNAMLGSYTGQFILSSFKLTGTRGQKITADITLDNNNVVTFVPAS